MPGLERGRVRRLIGSLVEDALVPNRSTFLRDCPVGVHFRNPGERHTEDPREKVPCAVVAQDDASPASVLPQLSHGFREVLPCRSVGLCCNSRAAVSVAAGSDSLVCDGTGVREEVSVDRVI